MLFINHVIRVVDRCPPCLLTGNNQAMRNSFSSKNSTTWFRSSVRYPPSCTISSALLSNIHVFHVQYPVVLSNILPSRPICYYVVLFQNIHRPSVQYSVNHPLHTMRHLLSLYLISTVFLHKCILLSSGRFSCLVFCPPMQCVIIMR